MKTTLIKLLLLVLLHGVVPMPANAKLPIVIKFSHVVTPDTPKGKAANYFAQRAAELTEGAVSVEVFPNSTLYKDKDEIQALQLGAVQMLAPSLAKLTQLGIREFEVFDLPYLFDDIQTLHRVTEGWLGANLLGRLETKGVKGLAFWDNGFKSFSANRPLHDLPSFKGLRIRIQPSKVLEAQIRTLGAQPSALPFSDTYQALRTGFIDGAENPHSNFFTQKIYEVQKHIALTNHGYLGYAVIANKRFWDNLPARIRYQLTQAIGEATEYANRIAQEENDQALRKIKATGKTRIYTPSSAERAELRRAMLATHAKMAPYIGQRVVDAVYEETGFDPGKQ